MSESCGGAFSNWWCVLCVLCDTGVELHDVCILCLRSSLSHHGIFAFLPLDCQNNAPCLGWTLVACCSTPDLDSESGGVSSSSVEFAPSPAKKAKDILWVKADGRIRGHTFGNQLYWTRGLADDACIPWFYFRVCEPLMSVTLELHMSNCVSPITVSGEVSSHLPTLLLHSTLLIFKPPVHPIQLDHAQCGVQATPLSQQH